MNSIFKKAIATITLLIMVITVSACNATPEQAIVQNKKDSRLMELIQSSGSGASDLKALAGKHVKETYRNKAGTVDIEIDADVVLPGADKLPVVEAAPKMLNGQDIQRLASALAGDEPMYEFNGQLTKDQIRQLILDWKKRKSEDQNKDLPADNGDGATPMGQDQIDEAIADYEKMLVDAPDEITYQPADYTKLGAADGNGYYYEVQTKPVNGLYKLISVENNPLTGSVIESRNPYYVEQFARRISDKRPEGLKLTEEEAVAKARKLIADIGMDGMDVVSVIADIGYATFSNNYTSTDEKLPCYQIAFSRTLSGVPSNYDYRYWTEEKVDEQHINMRYYESAFVYINDDGLLSFRWYCPLEITKVLNDDVGLVDFNKILDVAKTQVSVENAFCSDPSVDHMIAQIDTVQLGMMRIRMPDKPDSYLMVPVWDFYGKYQYHLKEKTPGWSTDDKGWAHVDNTARSILTVNAVDGTVINRELGY